MSTNCVAHFSIAFVCLCALGCSDPTGSLLAQLHGDDIQTRRKAARALADSQFADDERVVPALTAATRDDDLLVQEASITALGKFGTLAESALPELEQALSSTEPPIRLAAALAISKIDPTSTAFQQVIFESLRNGDPPIFLDVGQMGKNAYGLFRR
jgi:HEAT repeat protein